MWKDRGEKYFIYFMNELDQFIYWTEEGWGYYGPKLFYSLEKARKLVDSWPADFRAPVMIGVWKGNWDC